MYEFVESSFETISANMVEIITFALKFTVVFAPLIIGLMLLMGLVYYVLKKIGGLFKK